MRNLILAWPTGRTQTALILIAAVILWALGWWVLMRMKGLHHAVHAKNGNGVTVAEASFPHCDSRVLHAPGACVYCDAHPMLQLARQQWGIAYSGVQPGPAQLPCPADVARGREHYEAWPGNRAQKGRHS